MSAILFHIAKIQKKDFSTSLEMTKNLYICKNFCYGQEIRGF